MVAFVLLLAALSTVDAHQAVFDPEWSHRQYALSDAEHACSGVCLLTPEQMEGPFYLPYALDRTDITEGRPGIPVELTLTLFDVSASTEGHCAPLANSWVDIWSADAAGAYSGYGEEAELGVSKRDWNAVLDALAGGWPPPPPPGGPGRGPPRGPPGHVPSTNNDTFLRGVQKTDDQGKVTFHTIFPGWYPGRTTHIHLKVHPPSWQAEKEGTNGTHAHTTQLYFDEELNGQLSKLPPYVENHVTRTTNERDGLFRQMKGAGTLDAEIVGVLGEGEGYVKAKKDIGVDKWW